MSSRTIELAKPYDPTTNQPVTVVWGGTSLAATPWQGSAYVTLVGADGGVGASSVDATTRRLRLLGLNTLEALPAAPDDEIWELRKISNLLALLLNEFTTGLDITELTELETV